ncbi:hypothetical protein [Patulibacter sp. SYSU D01012]|uniref:hypothetical protein n=1 Tax=Patulibacter sp. SYSU D01012 TaxID=2817381 RepID=UPI001B3066D8|nr:hypothetical protein [Patulibacter sp. SYSU D01012]
MRAAARRIALGLALTAAGAGVAGCGGDSTGEEAYATKVAVYVGVPTRGPWAGPGLALARGAQLALADSGGGAGDYSVRLSIRDTTDDDGVAVSAAGASREAGNFLRDVGTIGAISGIEPVTIRQWAILAGQTGVAYVTANGGQTGATRADLAPRGPRLGVDLSTPDARIARAVGARVRAASCSTTILVQAQGAGAGRRFDTPAVDEDVRLLGSAWTDPQLVTGLGQALRRGADCVVLAGEPSAGDAADLLGPLVAQLQGRRIFLTRGAASGGVAQLARRERLRAEAVVDDPAPDGDALTRRIDALHRRYFGTPAPAGVMAGWRAMKLMLRAVEGAGPEGGNRRDDVADALVAARVPAPPAEAAQRPDGTVAATAVGLARPAAYGWRVVRDLDAPAR